MALSAWQSDMRQAARSVTSGGGGQAEHLNVIYVIRKGNVEHCPKGRVDYK